MSTFNLSPKNVNSIDKIAFPKNPDTKTLKSKFPFNVEDIPPNIESKAATIAIAKYFEYVYEITGALIPNIAPIKHPSIIAITINFIILSILHSLVSFHLHIYLLLHYYLLS